MGAPIDSNDAATKAFVLANVGSGDSGAVHGLISPDDGDVKIEAVDEGTKTYGKSENIVENNAAFQLVSFADDNAQILQSGLYDENIQHRLFSDRSIVFRISENESVEDLSDVLTLDSDQITSWEKLVAKQGISANSERITEVGDAQLGTDAISKDFAEKNLVFEALKVDNKLGGSLLSMGAGDVKWFDFKNRANSNKLICPSDFSLLFMFENTIALTLDSDTCVASANFEFDGETVFKKDVDLSNQQLKNLADPQDQGDAVNLQFLENYVAANGGGGDGDPIDIDSLDHLQSNGEKVFEVETNAYRLLSGSGDEQKCVHRTVYNEAESAIEFEGRYNNNFHLFIYNDQDQAKERVFKINRSIGRYYPIMYFHKGIDCVGNRLQNIAEPEKETDGATRGYVDNLVPKSLFDLDDVNAVTLNPLQEDDVLTWDEEESHFAFKPKNQFKNMIDAGKGVQSCADLIVHYSAYCKLQGNERKTVFTMKTSSTHHRYVTNAGATHIFSYSPVDGDAVYDIAFIGQNGCLFAKPAQFNQGISLFNQKIENVADAENDLDAVNMQTMKNYIANNGTSGNVNKVHLTNDTEAMFTTDDRIFTKCLSVFENNLYFRSNAKYTTRFTSDTSENAFKIENRHGSQFQVVCYDDADMNPKIVQSFKR